MPQDGASSNTPQHSCPAGVLPHGAEMAAVACDAGGHCSPGGTSGSAGAIPRPLVFSSGIAQFDELLDGGARTICHLCACRPACGLLWAGAILHSMHPSFVAFCIPATAAFLMINDAFHMRIPCILHPVFCTPCILHSCILHSSRSCVPEGQSYILHSMYPTRHSTKAAFRIRAHSLLFLAVQELCIVTAHRRCQGAYERICSCALVTDLVCLVAGVEAHG